MMQQSTTASLVAQTSFALTGETLKEYGLQEADIGQIQQVAERIHGQTRSGAFWLQVQGSMIMQCPSFGLT